MSRFSRMLVLLVLAAWAAGETAALLHLGCHNPGCRDNPGGCQAGSGPEGAGLTSSRAGWSGPHRGSGGCCGCGHTLCSRELDRAAESGSAETVRRGAELPVPHDSGTCVLCQGWKMAKATLFRLPELPDWRLAVVQPVVVRVRSPWLKDGFWNSLSLRGPPAGTWS